jgi:hypothetical protein
MRLPSIPSPQDAAKVAAGAVRGHSQSMVNKISNAQQRLQTKGISVKGSIKLMEGKMVSAGNDKTRVISSLREQKNKAIGRVMHMAERQQEQQFGLQKAALGAVNDSVTTLLGSTRNKIFG